MATRCGFAPLISAATLTTGIDGQTYTSHEDAHANGACARLFGIERNPTGAPLRPLKPHAARRPRSRTA
ncbi:hypothetical protein [Streptomyces albidoflavus]|uniref:hypothetical protein n=1 Tax=Streptomyces albidoflavus TaxID=1886 RepID=UPI001020BF84|nr:hypothetical protein [Streptomyces albidoflavus]RZF02871.1 hypothetical protein C0R05_32165 [Streptomyces albidoflavus]